MGDEITLEDELGEMRRWLRTLEQTAAELRGRYGEVVGRLDAAQVAYSSAQTEAEVLEQVTTLLQGLEGVWQKNFQKSVARVISRGLTLVFEEPRELKIVPKVRGDVTTVDFRLVKGEGDSAIETGVLGSDGGTVIALINVLIRALLILSSRPPLRRLLILDEPFGLADPHYHEAFGGLLRELVDRLGFQIILAHHGEVVMEQVADVTYEVYKTKRDGVSFRQHSRREVHA